MGGDKDHPGDGPNGIALSPDEKHFYVTAAFLNAGIDGIKVDRKGNVYSTVRGSAIWITSPDAKRLGVLQMPQVATEPRRPARMCSPSGSK